MGVQGLWGTQCFLYFNKVIFDFIKIQKHCVPHNPCTPYFFPRGARNLGALNNFWVGGQGVCTP